MSDLQEAFASIYLLTHVVLPCVVATGLIFWLPSVRNLVRLYLTPRQVLFLGTILPTMMLAVAIQPMPPISPVWLKAAVAVGIFAAYGWVIWGAFRTVVSENADLWKK